MENHSRWETLSYLTQVSAETRQLLPTKKEQRRATEASFPTMHCKHTVTTVISEKWHNRVLKFSFCDWNVLAKVKIKKKFDYGKKCTWHKYLAFAPLLKKRNRTFPISLEFILIFKTQDFSKILKGSKKNPVFWPYT